MSAPNVNYLNNMYHNTLIFKLPLHQSPRSSLFSKKLKNPNPKRVDVFIVHCSLFDLERNKTYKTAIMSSVKAADSTAKDMS